MLFLDVKIFPKIPFLSSPYIFKTYIHQKSGPRGEDPNQRGLDLDCKLGQKEV